MHRRLPGKVRYVFICLNVLLHFLLNYEHGFIICCGRQGPRGCFRLSILICLKCFVFMVFHTLYACSACMHGCMKYFSSYPLEYPYTHVHQTHPYTHFLTISLVHSSSPNHLCSSLIPPGTASLSTPLPYPCLRLLQYFPYVTIDSPLVVDVIKSAKMRIHVPRLRETPVLIFSRPSPHSHIFAACAALTKRLLTSPSVSPALMATSSATRSRPRHLHRQCAPRGPFHSTATSLLVRLAIGSSV